MFLFPMTSYDVITLLVARGDTPALYTVLPEKQSSVGGAMMGSSHVYDITAVSFK